MNFYDEIEDTGDAAEAGSDLAAAPGAAEALDADAVLVELQEAADGPDGLLKDLAKELLVARSDREEKARLASLASLAEDESLGLNLYQRMDAGLVDPADIRAVLAAQQGAEQDAYERRVLDSVRQKRIEEGADREAVEAAVDARKRDLASMRAEYQAADPLDLDAGYREYQQGKIEAERALALAEDLLRRRADAMDGGELIDGRIVRTSDLIAATLAKAGD